MYTIIFTSDINVVFIILVVVECNNDLMSGLHAPFGNYTEISSFSPFNNLQLHIESAQTSEVYICYYFLFFKNVFVIPLFSLSSVIDKLYRATLCY